MMRQLRCGFWVVSLAATVGLATFHSLSAQDDPFGAGPAKKPDKKQPKADESFKREGADEGQEKDPVVLSLLTHPPVTPEELTLAVKLMLDVNRPEEAAGYLEKLVNANVEPEVMVALRARFGSALFLRLTTDAALAPHGKQFGQAVLQASRKAADDAAHLSRLVAMLGDPVLETRTLAANDLRLAGRAALGPILKALADSKQAPSHAGARRLLVDLNIEAVEPLIGVLEADESVLRSDAIFVLGQLESPRATPYLLRAFLTSDEASDLRAVARAALIRIVGELPKQRDAQEFLLRRIRRLLAGEVPVRLDYEDRGELWHWNEAKKRPEPQWHSAYEVSLVEAARLARELWMLNPEPKEHRQLFLLTQLELAKARVGFDQPLPRGEGTAHSLAARETAAFIEELLGFSLRLRRMIGAVAITEVLGDIGSDELLVSQDGRPRTLVATATHADRRLRFAATEAILKIDPRQPFAGSSYVADTLGFVVGTVGVRVVIVGHPRVDESQSLVGMLQELGFDAIPAQSGRGVFQLAVKHPDCEFMLLADTLDHPATSEVLQMLRQDSHTANLTVGVIARPDFLQQAQRLVEHDPYSEAFARPYDTAGADFVVRRLAQRGARTLVGRGERLAQASVALDWIGRLLEAPQKYSFYDLYRYQGAVETGLQTPELTAKAAQILGRFGSPRAQQTLVDVASQHSRPLADRRAAADAFQAAVQRRGLLLTRDAVLLQYDRYNQTESLDAETQQLLSSVLDTIERKFKNPEPSEAAAESEPNKAGEAGGEPNAK